MDQITLFTAIISYIRSLPPGNPVYMDLLKVVVGSIVWIGGLIGFMYLRERKLRAAAINK